MFRHLFVYLFACSILLQSGAIAFWTVLRIKQHRAGIKAMMKAELRNGLHEADLVCFTQAELQNAAWVHEKEFVRNGEKFDVVRTSGTGSEKVYHCINDQQETILYKSLDKHGKRKNTFEDIQRKFAAAPFCLQAFAGQQIPDAKRLNGVYANSYRFSHEGWLFRPPAVQA